MVLMRSPTTIFYNDAIKEPLKPSSDVTAHCDAGCTSAGGVMKTLWSNSWPTSAVKTSVLAETENQRTSMFNSMAEPWKSHSTKVAAPEAQRAS